MYREWSVVDGRQKIGSGDMSKWLCAFEAGLRSLQKMGLWFGEAWVGKEDRVYK